MRIPDPPHLLRHEIPKRRARRLIVTAAVARAILHQLGGALAIVPEHRPGNLGDIGDIGVYHCREPRQSARERSRLAADQMILCA
jgi:hypothetical protein